MGKKKINCIITRRREEERATLKCSSISGYSSYRSLAALVAWALGKGGEILGQMIDTQQLSSNSDTQMEIAGMQLFVGSIKVNLFSQEVIFISKNQFPHKSSA